MNTSAAGEPRIRPMASADLEAVAGLHRHGFEGFRSTTLGPRFVRAMYRWFVTPQHGVAKIALVAEQDGRLAGFAVGATREARALLFRRTLPQIALGLLARPWLIAQPSTYRQSWYYASRALPLARRLAAGRHDALDGPRPDPEAATTLSLMSFAVSPAARGQQLGAQLLHAFEVAARTHGATRLSLGVLADNAPARRTYEAAGWTAIGSDGAYVTYIRTLHAPEDTSELR